MGDETLLERILNGDEEPKNLPLALLQSITNDFSQERKIGQGGFGAVYKGELQNGIIVAVKRIEVNQITIDDVSFRREFNSLMNTNHRNVVRFLGFCSNTHHIRIKLAGEINLVSVRQRLLCFEYIRNGSLDKHINDELRGLEWEPRYAIISGICKGLFYLHEEIFFVHMDLKPPNILLDDHMVPKITDFGLSRSNEMSHTTGQRFGTPGYVAPEYEKDGKTSFKCDVYSLGVIITELVTGRKSAPHKNNVLRRWRHRWNKPPTLLQYRQITRCIEISVSCRQQESRHRPSILDIISIMGESESTDGHTGQESTYLDDDMLCIEPLELKLNEEMSWSVKITNKTKACFAFNIERPNQQYTIWPDKGIVTPGCNERLVQITLLPQQSAPQVTQNADKFILQSTKVPEGLRDKDITENIFHEEAGKVVDEVDLMVVYEPTKPQENCKSREDTNMPAEEISEVKMKNEEATSKDANSSARGQCTEQTEQFNLHPLQSFSLHYPTNMRYLEEANFRAVDLRTGAMGSLLDKLGKLFEEDYNVEDSIKTNIKSFSEKLMKMHQILRQLGKLDGVKIWVDQARELSYHIEDLVDGFLVHVEPNSNRTGFRELPHKGLKLWEDGMTTHHQIGDVITHIKNHVQDVADMQENYNFNVNNAVANATAKTAMDLSSRYAKKEQLIGIKAPRDELIRLFEEDADISKRKTIFIVGMGGLGKTTLAKAVYDKLKKDYHHRAFIPVGQNTDVKKVLKDILFEFGQKSENLDLDLHQLVKKLRKLLKKERYFIVIDDIWDSKAWDIIQSALPVKKHGSRVITTTRIEHVARAYCEHEIKYVYRMKPLSEEESRRLFLRRTFGHGKDCADTPRKEEISKYILKKCGGMPLAINSIASLLHGKEESTWEYIWKSLASVTEEDDLEKMTQILDLSYMHLPGDLKTCLLYVCMYPEDREIYKDDLVRLWVAEGFVSANSGPDAEDVANKYFNDLISMSMIQPGERDAYNNEVLSCRVHDIMLDLLRSKSSEENFIRVIDGSKCGTGKIRRVSFHYNDKNDMRILETINKESLSQVRSVLLCRSSLAACFLEKFKYVRVLHLERDYYSSNLDLTGISRLFFLRYLKIAYPCANQEVLHEEILVASYLKLPNQIGELQQLETVDIQACYVEKYPSDIVSLPWLSHLSFTGIFDGVALPDGINRLTSLRTLAGVSLNKSSVDNILGLSKLTNLRELRVCLFTRPEEAITAIRMNALHSSISILSASLRIFTFRKNLNGDVRGWSSRKQFLKGSHIRKLHLEGCIFQRCPKCIGQLHCLNSFRIWVREVAHAVSIAAQLPSLTYFRLSSFGMGEEEEKEESVVIPGGEAYRALKELIFHCPKVALTFEAGAMPKLEKLDIHSHFKMNRLLLPVGIQNLPAGTLKEILLEAHWDEAEEDWAASEWDDYPDSVEYLELSTCVRVLWKQAFKRHHPDANIDVGLVCHYIGYDDGFGYAAGDEETLELVRQFELQLSIPVGLELSGLVDLLSLLHEMFGSNEDEDDEDEDEDDDEDEDEEDDEDEDEDDDEDEDEEDDEDEATSTDSSS